MYESVGLIVRLRLNFFCAAVLAGAALTGTSVLAQSADPAGEAGVEVYLPSAFAEFLPQNAGDLVGRLPGFQVDEGDNVRGLSGAQGNVLFNGRRPPPRSGSIGARLSTIRVEAVERLELIEAGARDVDMQGYPLLLNIVLRAETTTQTNGRMEIEPRENGGDEVQLALGASRSGGRINLEGNLELYDEALISYEDVRTATPTNPIVRETSDEDTTLSSREAQGSAMIPLGRGRSVTLSGAYDSYAETARPTAEEVASGAALQESSEFDNADTSFGVEYSGPLRRGMGLQAVITRTDGEQERSQSLRENGSDSRFSAVEETSETATRATIRWRLSPHWALETGGTWALNTLDGVSSATIDGVAQNIDGSVASVEETRTAALAVAAWTPRTDLSMHFGGRIENFALNSSNATDELTLTDVIPRADLTWSLENDWVLRLSAEREVGQLDLDLFLAETNLDNALNTSGASTLEPERDWTYRAELERRFGERSLLRFVAERRDVDNPISRIRGEDGEVRPANIGPETYDSLSGFFEVDMEGFGFPGLFIDGEAVLRQSERIDPLQGFVRETSGHRDYSYEIDLRQELAGGKYILGLEIEASAPATHYRTTSIHRVESDPSIRLTGEWRHTGRWRTGFWSRLPESQTIDYQIYDGARAPDTGPVLENRIERNEGSFISLWTEYEIREEVHLRLNYRTGRARDAFSEVFDPDGARLDMGGVDVDNVPSFNIRLRWNR